MAPAYYLTLVCGLYYSTSECDTFEGCTLSRISPALPNMLENVWCSISYRLPVNNGGIWVGARCIQWLLCSREGATIFYSWKWCRVITMYVYKQQVMVTRSDDAVLIKPVLLWEGAFSRAGCLRNAVCACVVTSILGSNVAVRIACYGMWITQFLNCNLTNSNKMCTFGCSAQKCSSHCYNKCTGLQRVRKQESGIACLYAQVDWPWCAYQTC